MVIHLYETLTSTKTSSIGTVNEDMYLTKVYQLSYGNTHVPYFRFISSLQFSILFFITESTNLISYDKCRHIIN